MSVYAYVGPHWLFWPLMALCYLGMAYVCYELFKGPRK